VSPRLSFGGTKQQSSGDDSNLLTSIFCSRPFIRRIGRANFAAKDAERVLVSARRLRAALDGHALSCSRAGLLPPHSTALGAAKKATVAVRASAATGAVPSGGTPTRFTRCARDRVEGLQVQLDGKPGAEPVEAAAGLKVNQVHVQRSDLRTTAGLRSQACGCSL
jgi:hypothetical protein